MFFDIGVGILLSILVHILFQSEISIPFVFFAIAASLFPDIDFCIEYIKHGSVGGKFIREHRELLHFPLLYIPLLLVIFLVFGKIYGILVSLALFSHFLHDSIGIGWGIQWLSPFSKKSYKLFSDKNGQFSSQILVSWTPEERTKVVTEKGDPNWIKNIYLKPHPINIFEFCVFLISLLVLFFFT